MRWVRQGLGATLMAWALVGGIAQAQAQGLFGASQMEVDAFLASIDGSCFDFQIVGLCPSLWCTDCVVVTYWIPTLAVEVYKMPGDTVLAIPLLNGLKQAALAAANIPLIGGGGGDNAGQSGKGSLHYYDTRVWQMPPVLTQACSLCEGSGGEFALAYTSEIDPHWRTGEITAPGVLHGAALQGARTWGPLTPLVGHVVHGSPHVAAAVAATRGMLITSTPQIPPRPVFAATTPSACIQPAWPAKKSCMVVGSPPLLWDHGILAFRGKYLFIFWEPRTCCLSSSAAACGLGTRAVAEATLGTGGTSEACGLELGLAAPLPPLLPPTERSCTFMPSGGSGITGRTYVVSNTAELKAALSRAKPGDGVLLEAGSYTVESSTLSGLGSGTNDRPIIIRPAPGAEGKVYWHPRQRHRGNLNIEGVSNIVFEGLKMHGYSSTIKTRNSSYIVLSRCRGS